MDCQARIISVKIDELQGELIRKGIAPNEAISRRGLDGECQGLRDQEEHVGCQRAPLPNASLDWEGDSGNPIQTDSGLGLMKQHLHQLPSRKRG